MVRFRGAELLGGRLLGIGVLAHGFSCDPEFFGDGRRDSPFNRACWIDFHRAFWVGVGVRSHGFRVLLTTSFAATAYCCLVQMHRFQGGQTPLLGLADVVSPTLLTIVKGGGSRVATVCPWYWTMSSLSGRSSTSTRNPA